MEEWVKSNISVVVCSFFEFWTASKWCIMEWVNWDFHFYVAGLIGIGGTALAPFSLGFSAVLAAVGVAMSVGGTVVSSKAEDKISKDTTQKMDYSKSLLEVFNKKMNEWNEAAELLSEIVEELQELFSDLEFRFCRMLGSIEDCTYKDESSYKVECFLKCVSNFYGVAKTSTHVVRNVDKITLLAMRVRHIKTIVLTGKKVGEVAKTAKGVVVQIALGKPNCFFSTTKQVVNTGRQVVSTVKHSQTVTKTAKIVTLAAEGSDKVVKTEKAVQLIGNTITKETVTVTKTVSKIGLGLGVVFAAVDLYQLRSAIKASNSKCDAEKELQSCIQNMDVIKDQVMNQVNVYIEVMKIKYFFENLVEHGREMVFGQTQLPLERVGSCLRKINNLYNIMN